MEFQRIFYFPVAAQQRPRFYLAYFPGLRSSLSHSGIAGVDHPHSSFSKKYGWDIAGACASRFCGGVHATADLLTVGKIGEAMRKT